MEAKTETQSKGVKYVEKVLFCVYLISLLVRELVW